MVNQVRGTLAHVDEELNSAVRLVLMDLRVEVEDGEVGRVGDGYG